MRKPLIDTTGQVVNIIEVEDGADYTPPAGLTMLDEHPDAMIGGTYDQVAAVFTPPPAPEMLPVEPTEVERKAALYDQAVRDGLLVADPSVSVAPEVI